MRVKIKRKVILQAKNSNNKQMMKIWNKLIGTMPNKLKTKKRKINRNKMEINNRMINRKKKQAQKTKIKITKISLLLSLTHKIFKNNTIKNNKNNRNSKKKSLKKLNLLLKKIKKAIITKKNNPIKIKISTKIKALTRRLIIKINLKRTSNLYLMKIHMNLSKIKILMVLLT